MVVAFLDFHDATQTSLPRLTPTKLAQDLRDITLKFIEYGHIAVNSCDTIAHDASKKIKMGEQKFHGVHSTSPSWDTSTAQSIPRSYEPSYFDIPNIKSSFGPNPQLHGSFSRHILTPSFAHFLEYSINDHALMCLSSPETDAKEILRIFKLCFSYHTVDQISIYLHRSLLGLADDDEVPLRHLGGAGLHYRSPEDMKYLSQSLKMPSTLSNLVQNAKERGITPDLINGLSEFEGEWLDARDVEQYLYQKGIVMNGKSLKVVTSFDKLMPLCPISLNSAAAALQATPPSSHPTEVTSVTLSHVLSDCAKPLSDTKSVTQVDTNSPYIPGYNQKSNSFYFGCDHFGFGSASSINATELLTSSQHLSPDRSFRSYVGDCNNQVFLDLEIMIESMFQRSVMLLAILILTDTKKDSKRLVYVL